MRLSWARWYLKLICIFINQKYHAWKQSCLCSSFCWGWKKKVSTCRRRCSQKSWKCVIFTLRGSVMLMIMKRHHEYHIATLENALKTESYIQSKCITEALLYCSFVFIKWAFYIWIIVLICTFKECLSIEERNVWHYVFPQLSSYQTALKTVERK